MHARQQLFLHRTGPSFVRALAGLDPKRPLTAADIWPGGPATGHGLVIVGSHVGRTACQVVQARARSEASEVELSVPELA